MNPVYEADILLKPGVAAESEAHSYGLLLVQVRNVPTGKAAILHGSKERLMAFAERCGVEDKVKKDEAVKVS